MCREIISAIHEVLRITSVEDVSGIETDANLVLCIFRNVTWEGIGLKDNENDKVLTVLRL